MSRYTLETYSEQTEVTPTEDKAPTARQLARDARELAAMLADESDTFEQPTITVKPVPVEEVTIQDDTFDLVTNIQNALSSDVSSNLTIRSNQDVVLEQIQEQNAMSERHKAERSELAMVSKYIANDSVSAILSAVLIGSYSSRRLTDKELEGKYLTYGANRDIILGNLSPQAQRVLVVLNSQDVLNNNELKQLFKLNLSQIIKRLNRLVKLTDRLTMTDEIGTRPLLRAKQTIGELREQLKTTKVHNTCLVLHSQELIQQLYSTDGRSITGKRGLAIDMSLNGSSIKDISKHINKPVPTVKRWLQQNKVLS